MLCEGQGVDAKLMGCSEETLKEREYTLEGILRDGYPPLTNGTDWNLDRDSRGEYVMQGHPPKVENEIWSFLNGCITFRGCGYPILVQ